MQRDPSRGVPERPVVRPGQVAERSGAARATAIAMLVGGALAAVGALLRWNRFRVGLFAFVGKAGVRGGASLVVLILGAILVLRSVTFLRGTNPTIRPPGAPDLLIATFAFA